MCCFVHAKPKQWRHWLLLAEYWYNTSYHTTIHISPFEALYGHHPRHFGVTNVSACQSSDLAAWLKERSPTLDLLKQHLTRARQIMKTHADKHRSGRHFNMGNWVFLKVQPYVQQSIAERASHKLAFRFFGPFQVGAGWRGLLQAPATPEGTDPSGISASTSPTSSHRRGRPDGATGS
jgi:hypothetical protein